jgi:hypothetical protein
MNNVFTKNQAVQGDRLTRFVRHGVAVCLLACSAAGAMAAGQDRGPRREDMQQQQSMRERFDTRAQDARYEQMREEARRAQEQSMRERAMREEAMREESRRTGRMTPDERSDLRRQINEAGRDLYPNARRR